MVKKDKVRPDERELIEISKVIAPLTRELALDIWNHPETGLNEYYAAGKYVSLLEKEGFSVIRGVGPLDTALVAEWGKGSPKIGFLGEYDALPGLSQKVKAHKDPVQENSPGHGCGHNLLGAASFGAALVLKIYLERHGLDGTVRFYGCPAEENNGGKLFMAEEGVFNDLDATLTWHPWYANTVWNAGSLALNAANFNFRGVTAHAASAPHLGRSALDAAIIMDVGVNYLREHIEQESRIHSVITNGGQTPNVVPHEASICYYVRAPRRKQVEDIYRRVVNCARGAALMTDTEMEIDFIDGLYDYLSNKVISRIMQEKFEILGAPEFDKEEMDFAHELQSTLNEDTIESALRYYETDEDVLGNPLSLSVLGNAGPFGKGRFLPGSTDVGNISYLVPTGQITVCSMPLGVAPHTWQSTASFGSSIGLKGMERAMEVLSLSGLELMMNKECLQESRNEFISEIRKAPYVSPMPEQTVPRRR